MEKKNSIAIEIHRNRMNHYILHSLPYDYELLVVLLFRINFTILFIRSTFFQLNGYSCLSEYRHPYCIHFEYDLRIKTGGESTIVDPFIARSMVSYGSINKQPSDVPTSKHDEIDDEKTSLLPDGKTLVFQHEERAHIWDKLTFGWMNPLMQLGNAKKKLDPDDIRQLPLPNDARTGYLRDAFEEAWTKEMSKAKANGGEKDPSLIMTLFRAFGFDCVVNGFILKIIHDSCVFVGPLVLNRMILFLGSDEYPISYGLLLTLAVTLSQLTMSFCLRHYFFKCYKFGLKIRTAVMVAVYEKALVLSAGERHTRSLGEITNLMSIDAQRLQELTTYLHAVWFSFYQIGLALFLLWQQL